MDANVTASQSELDHDNSSLQNPSTNPAEAGTTDETRDEDHETSSIEALNWSEVEEEELAAAQQASLQACNKQAASASQEKKVSPETKVNNKSDKDDESVTNNGSSTNDEGSVLSTTLLQSINSSVSDEDPQARKQSVIENWASEVTNAVERGEIEMTEDFPDENGTGDEEEEVEKDDGNGVRKRKGKKLSPEMVSSMISSASNGESIVDPLSNAPVLDDGPIWNKGPRSYTFQENRRINQKLTFCLLIAVVLAIGLGLGNLVAHQECEAEYKASQQPQAKPTTDKIPVHTVPTTTTPAPIIPDRSTDSSMMSSSLPKKQPISYVDSVASNENVDEDYLTTSNNGQGKRQTLSNANEDRPRKRDDPVIDPKYKVHAETVSNVVHTLDRLSREIDQFENTTRKLQGVLMIPEEEEKITETSNEERRSIFDEEVHIDGEESSNSVKIDDEMNLDLEDEEDETAIIEDLIDAIEQTPDYLEMKRSEKQMEEAMERDKNRPRSKIFSPDPVQYPGRDKDFEMMLKSIQQFKEFQRRFVKSERKRMRDEGKFHKFSWRLPEEYSVDEKNALRVRYSSNWQEFLRLLKTKVPDPIETLFGAEEDEEERTYGDVFHYPFPDPEDDLTPDEYSEQFRKNLEELRIFEKKSARSEADKEDSSGDQSILDATSTPTTNGEPLVEAPPILDEIDDLVISEVNEGQLDSTESAMKESVAEQDQQQDDNIIGKSTTTIDEPTVVKTATPLKADNSQSAFSTDANVADKTTNKGEKLSLGRIKREATSTNPKKSANKVADSSADAADLNGKEPQGQEKLVNAKYAKREQKQKDQKYYKQGKQKVRNVGNDSNGNIHSTNIDNGDNSGNLKMSSKGKKLKNLESNKVFENVKGKSFDKRRGASSSETQRNGKFDTDIKYTDLRNSRNSAAYKKSPNGSTNKKEEHNSDTPSASNAQEKLRQAQNNFDNDNQKTKLKSNARDYQNQPNEGSSRLRDPKYKYSKDQKQQRQDGQNEKANSDSSSSESQSGKSHQEASSKETQYRQQRTEFNAKHDNRNNNHNAGNPQNGKRSKSWQSKEKADRREKARERGSSWGN